MSLQARTCSGVRCAAPFALKLNHFVPATAAIRPDTALPGRCSALGTFQHSCYYPRKLRFHDPSSAVFLQALEKEHHAGLLWAAQPWFPFPARGLGRHRLPGDPGDCPRDLRCPPCSSSYPRTFKLCENKLLNGKECLQLNLQSTINFPKSFYSTVSLE